MVKQVFAHSLPWPDRLLATETVPTSKDESHVILGFSEPLTDAAGATLIPVGLPADVTFLSTGEAMSRLSLGK